MFKKFLVSLLAVFSVGSLAQAQYVNTNDANRVLSIDSYYDQSGGVRMMNPFTQQLVHFPNLNVTIGRLAVHECIHWGNAVTPWWIFWDRRGYSIARAKECAGQVLAPLYASRKLAIQDARSNLSIPQGVIPIPNFFSLPQGFVVHSLVTAEYKNLSDVIDQIYVEVYYSGWTWNQLSPNGAVPRSTDPNAAPIV